MLASIIFATVALIAGLNAHKDPQALPPSPATAMTVQVQCKYWVPTEKCIMHNMKKYKSVYDYEKDVHMNVHHHMMKKNDDDHKECLNKIDWWVKCPYSYDDFEHCNDLDSMGNKMNLKNCRYSCQECGEDAFMTVEKSYYSDHLDKCAEFSHHSPFHCVKPATHMKIKPAFITALYTPSKADCSGGAANEINYCVEFDYRRRGSDNHKERAASFTKFVICEQTSDGMANNELDVVHEHIEPTCHDDEGALVAGAKKYDDNDECVYNKWFRATYQFPTLDDADCDHTKRIILEVTRGVDFFDIDNFHVYEGNCHNNDNMHITPGSDINVEMVQKPTPP